MSKAGLYKSEWALYKGVDYKFGITGGTRPFREKKLERANFGIGRLMYRTVRRTKLVLNYLKNASMISELSLDERKIIIHVMDKKKVRKFYTFIKINRLAMSEDTRQLFEEIHREKKLSLFSDLGT